MEQKVLIPAAQYVRMSTDEQQYSIANQKAAIQTYAETHGYTVAATYADLGKSGIEIRHRKELRRLLADVMSGRAQYKAILVYDVSRWGRFQDVDEAAHYEFLCKSAGVPVRYCAEQFHNDGSLANSMMKALKRTMAGEYSRELGIRVTAAQRRIAALGFRVVGAAGYGLRRMIVSADGSRKLLLKDGERKAIQTDRTILVPGPKKEVACIRTIFDLADARTNPREIANELNARHSLSSGARRWDRDSVYRILINDKYAGCNTYGKTTQELCSRSRIVERHLWVTNPNAFVPLVSREIFDRVQKIIRKRGGYAARTDAYFIQGMKKVLAREGKLTKRILERKFTFSHTYYRRFGSVMKAYELAGFQPPSPTRKLIDTQMRVKTLRNDLFLRLKQLFSDRVRFISLPGQQFRRIVEIDGCLPVSIYLCRSVDKTSGGAPGWLLRVRPLERDFPALICTVDRSFSKLLNFYVFSPFRNSIAKYKVFREGRAWLPAGRRLSNLDEFCDVAKEATTQSTGKRYNSVDDILISNDTSMLVLNNKEVVLGPVGAALFSILARNVGEVVSRERLGKVSPALMDTHNLNAHMSKLRAKLGVEGGKRIHTVKGMGYLYKSPSRGEDEPFGSQSQFSLSHGP